MFDRNPWAQVGGGDTLLVMSSDPIAARDLRVSDDERAHVINLLQRATGRGLLDLDEFNRRSAAAIAARTRGDLNGLLLDLPGLRVDPAAG